MVTRFEGVVLNESKHIIIALRSIYGIGKFRSKKICFDLGIPFYKKVSDLSTKEISSIRKKLIRVYLRRKFKKIYKC